MTSKLLDLIAQLEATIDDSPRPRINAGSKRIVDMDAVSDLFSDLRVSIPDELRWAQNVLAEKDEIIEDAHRQAEMIVIEAREQREKLIDAQSISIEAELRARELIDRAKKSADLITEGARSYTDDILFDLKRYLNEYVTIIEKNRLELHDAYDPEEDAQAAPEEVELPAEETEEQEQ